MNKTSSNKDFKESKAMDELLIAGVKYVPAGDSKAAEASAQAVASPLTDRALSAVRGNKLKPITVTIPYSISWGCDSSGLCAQTTDIQPWLNTTEWGAWSTLYSEFRCLSARAEFGINARLSGVSFLSSTMFAMGYDPISSAAPAGVRQITELSQHKLLSSELITAGASASSDVYGYRGGLHKFVIRFPKGPMVAGSSTAYTSVWTSTLAPISPGAVKVYSQTSNVSSNICTTIMYVRVEFRSRAM